MLCVDEVLNHLKSAVSDLCSNSFWKAFLYRNSSTLDPDLFSSKSNIHIDLKQQQTDFLKRVRKIHRS